jgi:hypothetical protein
MAMIAQRYLITSSIARTVLHELRYIDGRRGDAARIDPCGCTVRAQRHASWIITIAPMTLKILHCQILVILMIKSCIWASGFDEGGAQTIGDGELP